MEQNKITGYAPADLKLDFYVENPFLDAVAVCARVHNQNSRQGTVACKDRGEVTSRSNKKPWKQKGTGKARAGSPRSPLWRGGGVVFGPQARTRKLAVSKKVLHRALSTVLAHKALANSVLSFNHDFSGVVKTKEAYSALVDSGLLKGSRRITLFYSVDDLHISSIFANIANVDLISYDAVHPSFLANNNVLVFLEKDKSIFNSMVESWQ